ncbi:MAG: DUF3426 domain-containing protein [Pseudomonadota bacterium]
MALATKCPHCNTTFRVAADQLKLRGGIVRCGTCSQVFDGNAALVDLDAIAKTNSAQLAPEPELEHQPEAAFQPEVSAVHEPEAQPEPEAAQELAGAEADSAPPTHPYVLDFDLSQDTFPEQDSDPVEAAALELAPDAQQQSKAEPAIAEEDDSELSVADIDDVPPVENIDLDEVAAALDRDLEAAPLPLLRASAGSDDVTPAAPEALAPSADEEYETDEPEFVRLAREKEEAGRRRTLIMGVGSFILLLALAAQSIIVFGNVLVAKYPTLKPTVLATCALLRCKVQLPSQIDDLAIETSELQTMPNGNLVLTLLLRNESGLTQAWPHIELELKDANDKPQVRRVFTPAQYLPQNVTPAKGFAARSEQPIKIYFELKQVKASGFHTAIFYP